MYTTDFAPVNFLQAAAAKRLRGGPNLFDYGNLLNTVQNAKSMAPPNPQQVAQIHAILQGMNLGRRPRNPGYGMQTLPYNRNMPPPVMQTLPAPRTFGDPLQATPVTRTYGDPLQSPGMPRTYNDPLQQLLYRLGQGR